MRQNVKQNIPPWNTTIAPLYDIKKSYLENAENGPFFSGVIPHRLYPPEEQWIDFFGFRLASPLGIAAGPLLNARWIALAGSLGFDLVCYKTIRSKEYGGHPVPNMVYVDVPDQFNINALPEKIYLRESAPQQLSHVAVTNSFGMPSRNALYLQKDIPLAKKSLKNGQLMIVSVVGTPQGDDREGFIHDFVAVALQAKAYGAQVIEANFSCPNVTSAEGCLHSNDEMVYEVAKRIVEAIGSTPLIIKVGIFPSQQSMRKTLLSIARAGARGVCGINTVSMNVVDAQGLPALGPGRLVSGICGNPIRQAALDFTHQARKIIDEEKLELKLLSTGGALYPEHFTEFINAGADIAMTATGWLWDPYLGIRYSQKNSKIGE